MIKLLFALIYIVGCYTAEISGSATNENFSVDFHSLANLSTLGSLANSSKGTYKVIFDAYFNLINIPKNLINEGRRYVQISNTNAIREFIENTQKTFYQINERKMMRNELNAFLLSLDLFHEANIINYLRKIEQIKTLMFQRKKWVEDELLKNTTKFRKKRHQGKIMMILIYDNIRDILNTLYCEIEECTNKFFVSYQFYIHIFIKMQKLTCLYNNLCILAKELEQNFDNISLFLVQKRIELRKLEENIENCVHNIHENLKLIFEKDFKELDNFIDKFKGQRSIIEYYNRIREIKKAICVLRNISETTGEFDIAQILKLYYGFEIIDDEIKDILKQETCVTNKCNEIKDKTTKIYENINLIAKYTALRLLFAHE